jgi:hypothetical protein
MISLLCDFTQMRQLTDAAIAPPHAAKMRNTDSSQNALSDCARIGLSRNGAHIVQRMIVRVAGAKASVMHYRPPNLPL